MAAPDYYTWDYILGAGGRSARAASVDDLGGAQLRDDAAYPPIPPEMPYAAQLNQWAKQLAGMNRVVTALDLEVGYVAGSPVILNATAMSGQIVTSLVIAGLGSTFTLAHPAAGQVIFGWAAGILPPPRAKPRAWITDPNPYAAPVVVALTSSVKVYTWDNGGTPTDAPFVISIY